jgi:hypothetical protein
VTAFEILGEPVDRIRNGGAGAVHFETLSFDTYAFSWYLATCSFYMEPVRWDKKLLLHLIEIAPVPYCKIMLTSKNMYMLLRAEPMQVQRASWHSDRLISTQLLFENPFWCRWNISLPVKWASSTLRSVCTSGFEFAQATRHVYITPYVRLCT